MGTLFVGIIVFGMVAGVVVKMVKDKKKGKPVIGCSGDCSHCGGHCH